MNSWIDIPVIQTVEYFTSLMAQALIWARRYAFLFGVVGIIWSSLKVMTSRMQVKQMFWDTVFKWAGFTLLVTFFPALCYGFLGIATEIGENAGMGKTLVEQDLKRLYSQCKKSETWTAMQTDNLTRELAEQAGIQLTTTFTLEDTYVSFMDKVNAELENYSMGGQKIPVFSSNRDLKKADELVKRYEEELPEDTYFLFSGLTMKVLNSVCSEKTITGGDGESLVDTYVQLDIYLKDRNGDNTMFISPAAMLRLSVLCGNVMHDRWQYDYSKTSEGIDGEDGWEIKKLGKKFVHLWAAIPQMVELLFCQIVLIVAVAFAMIQYIMTIIEFTIVTSIAAIFLPMMLFDGTKDIPKKFIPVLISFMIKIIVMLICMYFVMYLLIQHTINTITETVGMNLFTLCEVFFIAALSYVLTQNAPKIAQTILTGQPQLSMGEAVTGAGTALGTAAAIKQAPHAATMGASKLTNKAADIAGALTKTGSAMKSAISGLSPNATNMQKIGASLKAGGAVAANGLKDRMKTKFEQAGQEGGSGFSVVDKAMNMAGLSRNGGDSGSGFAGSGSAAYGQNGTTKPTSSTSGGQSLSANSNRNFKNALIYDDKIQGMRHMTRKEFMEEKKSQGQMSYIDDAIRKESEKEGNQNKNSVSGVNENNNLPEEGFGGERAGEI